MKYIKTFESHTYNKKYYDVIFNKSIIIDKLYVGENKYVKLKINEGDEARIFIDYKDKENFIIRGIKPLKLVENNKSVTLSNSINFSDLWNGNFIIDSYNVDVKNMPFTFL